MDFFPFSSHCLSNQMMDKDEQQNSWSLGSVF